MKTFTMRLFEDVLPAGCAPVFLPALARAIYVLEGDLTIEHGDGAQHHRGNSAWLGDSEIALLASAAGAKLWRWELLPTAEFTPGGLRSAPAVSSECKLEAEIELDPAFHWLMRCDRVDFPPGGIAHTHVHQGPGIRCCLSGEIAIETLGQRHVHPPGSAWLELGHAPVLAPTTESEPTAFIRCFVLPRALRGRSSIRYVHPEDLSKDKPQTYHVFGDRFISLG